MRRWWLLLGAACAAAALMGCEAVPVGPTGVATVTVPPAQCTPSDQDQYVYHPARLRVLQSCIRVTGVVAASRVENDGDVHLQLRLDAPYQFLLQPANGLEGGDLVVEPVCATLPIQPDALEECAADGDPLTLLPAPGQHVWMEGRYVLDGEHGDWAELHPLYRWGAETSAGRALEGAG